MGSQTCSDELPILQISFTDICPLFCLLQPSATALLSLFFFQLLNCILNRTDISHLLPLIEVVYLI